MKRKATFCLEDGLLRTLRVAAARSGKGNSHVVEEALRAYVGFELLDHVSARSHLGEDEAFDVANEERHR